MSHFPLNSGCRVVCRPVRSATRHFTPKALTRIVRKMIEIGYDEAEICEAVYLGGASCECVGAKKVGAYADILYEQTATVAFERGTAMMHQVQDWVRTIQQWVSAFEKAFGSGFVDRVPPVLANIPIVRVLLFYVNRALNFATWTASALILLDNIMEALDTEAQALRKVSDFAKTICTSASE